MKDTYEDVQAFIKDVFPIEYRKIIHAETEPEDGTSDSAAYTFAEKLAGIIQGEGK